MSSRSPQDIFRILGENREKIRLFGVRRLELFGSGARGGATETSDLDFLVVFEKKSFDAYMDLKFFLEGLFGCTVDIVLPETIKPRIKPSILKEAIHVPGL